MKFGMCTDIHNLEKALAVGADFIEVGNGQLAELTEEQLDAALKVYEKHTGTVLVANGFFPPNLRIVGEETDDPRLWIEESVERLSKFGVKCIVFGSGKARNCPKGFPKERAMEQLVEVTRLLASVAMRKGMTVVIEPLRMEETNMIRTAADSCHFAKLADRPNVRGHVDFYHFMQNGEKIPDLEPCVATLAHVHIASPCRREIPTPDDCANYKLFLDTLRRNGYDGTVSYEGIISDAWERMAEYFRFIKSL